MSTILDIFRASGGTDCIIPTLELTCSAWPSGIYICAGFDDLVAIDENGRQLIFTAAGINTSLPKKSNDGGQRLGVAIDNVTGEAQQKIDAAKDAGAQIIMTYRAFLESDPSQPAEPPFTMTALSASMEGATVNTIGGYYDLINSSWPRITYTTALTPGVKYIV